MSFFTKLLKGAFPSTTAYLELKAALPNAKFIGEPTALSSWCVLYPENGRVCYRFGNMSELHEFACNLDDNGIANLMRSVELLPHIHSVEEIERVYGQGRK